MVISTPESIINPSIIYYRLTSHCIHHATSLGPLQFWTTSYNNNSYIQHISRIPHGHSKPYSSLTTPSHSHCIRSSSIPYSQRRIYTRHPLKHMPKMQPIIWPSGFSCNLLLILHNQSIVSSFRESYFSVQPIPYNLSKTESNIIMHHNYSSKLSLNGNPV